jgi:hypothetical protein
MWVSALARSTSSGPRACRGARAPEIASREGREVRKGRNGGTTRAYPTTCHCEKARSAGGRGNPSKTRSNARANQLDRHVAVLLAMTNRNVGSALARGRLGFLPAVGSGLARAPSRIGGTTLCRPQRNGVRRLDAAFAQRGSTRWPPIAIGRRVKPRRRRRCQATALHSCLDQSICR